MKINGNAYDFEAMSVTQVLSNLSLSSNEVVVEVNGMIIHKDIFEEFIVDKEAVVELVAFVGGG
jgi:sulfur carrier protein